MTTPKANPILQELHAARQKLLADCHGDTAAYLREAQARLEQSGRPIWQGEQRSIQKSAVNAVMAHGDSKSSAKK